VASNYDAICDENRQRYGTEGAQKSGGLAASLYDDRAHFIFELLQNAEDALRRRGDWHGSRKVTFTLFPTRLTLSHFGKPFNEADVRSVCDIAESTKDETSIGRFGLGFKSVYTVTDLPEIHSGTEDFAIQNYVFPKRADHIPRDADETQIVLPLRQDDATAPEEIAEGFKRLGPRALLFLRHIEEINWSAASGASGFYLRNSPETLGPNVRRVTVIGQATGEAEVDQNWLVFHRDVHSAGQQEIGRVEIAFSLVALKDVPGRWAIQPLASSPLVVFFPTVVETRLGFLVQGPYRTTPSRDNIPPADIWNQYLVKETASLLVEAMRWMREKAMLDVSALRCLPLDRAKFPLGSQFVPIFEDVYQGFHQEALLPTFDGNYVTAKQAKLARTQDLRELLSAEQLAVLFGSEVAAWLSGDITQDKEPEILRYLVNTLDIDLITPTKLMPSLTTSFLEAQADDWVLRLYEFLNGQEAASLRGRLTTVPLIRLEDGTHVFGRGNGEAKVFLPGAIATGFRTVRRTVCGTSEARAFLSSLGITEPDPVDDVIQNILPTYRKGEGDVDDDAYAADIERIRLAFSTDSTAQKEKLRSALRETNFVMVVDTGDGKDYVAKPGDVYIASDRLKQLFAGVPDVLLVDDEYSCLRGEDIRDLLAACGASRYLAPQPTASGLGQAERVQLRKEAGLERASWDSPPENSTIRGLEQLLGILPKLAASDARARAGLLWDALADLEGRNSAVFYGLYKWGYSHETKTARFDAAFVRMLNQAAWVPNSDDGLAPPGLVAFDDLGWKPNSFLLTKIVFKPPKIDQLAREVGIDPAVLDLLRRNPTDFAELVARLSKTSLTAAVDASADLATNTNNQSAADVYADAKDLHGDDMVNIPPGKHDPDGGDGAAGGGAGTGAPLGGSPGKDGASGGSGGQADRGGQSGGATGGGGKGKRSPGHAGGRPFISYVGVHPDDDESDPDGLDQETRMKIEERAIAYIIELEPVLRRTKEGNKGFDLYEACSDGALVRWVEVKSMTGSLAGRPVTLSRAQFDCAREHGPAYWLYVAEHARDAAKIRILRIQDPSGRAKYFTFDEGWAEIAQTQPPKSGPPRASNNLE